MCLYSVCTLQSPIKYAIIKAPENFTGNISETEFQGGTYHAPYYDQNAQRQNRRSEKLAADKVAAALVDAIGCNPEHISVAVEDFTPVEWQDEFRKEVTESEHIYKEPHYDPKDVL